MTNSGNISFLCILPDCFYSNWWNVNTTESTQNLAAPPYLFQTSEELETDVALLVLLHMF